MTEMSEKRRQLPSKGQAECLTSLVSRSKDQNLFRFVEPFARSGFRRPP
jgi:hypothetical protein